MADLHAFIWIFVGLGVLHQCIGLISDYKVCGDPECASMMSRVKAYRDHHAQDCHFLNFRKGDIITVYYKLTGKRSDLWAGSKGKLFGLFPKDAVKVDQRFVDEKKEIQVPTQEYDFFCIDENGSVIDSNPDFDDLEDVTQEPHEAEIHEVPDKLVHTEEIDPGQMSVPEVSDQNSPKTAEQGGSSWIGSAVSGLFGRNEQKNMEEHQENSGDQEPFKSRKISMNIQENDPDEKTNPGTFGWIRGELTNAFGFKDSKIDTQDMERKKVEKEPSSQQSTSWLSMGMDVLGIAKDGESKPEVEIKRENTNMDKQTHPDPSVDSTQNMLKEENSPDHSVKNGDRALKPEEKPQAGWHGPTSDGITDIKSEEQSKSNEGKDNGTEGESAASNTEDNGNKEPEPSSSSMFSVSSFSSVLDNIKLPFQSDKVVKNDVEQDNDQTTKDEDRGKKEQEEKQNEQTDVSDLNLDEIQSDKSMNLRDTDESGATGKIHDHLHDSGTLNDDKQDSTAPETSETQSTENLIEDVGQSEYNMDHIDRQMERTQQGHLKSEKDKPTKQVDLVKEDVLEYITSPMDLIRETQKLYHERISVESDGIKKVNDAFQDDDIQKSKDSEVSEIKSADNSMDTDDLNAYIVNDELKQSDQENDSDTLNYKQEMDHNVSLMSITTNPIVSSDSDEIHTSEISETAPQTESESVDTEKQISGFEDSYTDPKIDIVTTDQSKNADSETTMNALSGNSDNILAVQDIDTEIKNSSLNMLNGTEINVKPLDEVSEDIMKNGEKQSDSETLETEISYEYKRNTSSLSLDESKPSSIHNHEKAELVETSDENVHLDLISESHSAQKVINEKMENNIVKHEGLLETDKTDIGIEENSESKHPDGVMEEAKEPSLILEENNLKTKHVQTDSVFKALNSDDNTHMKNEYLSQEASSKGGLDRENSLSDSNNFTENLEKEANADNRNVRKEEPTDRSFSGEAKLTKDLFEENDPKSPQGTEYDETERNKMEIDVSNRILDNQSKVESVTHVQTNPVDKTVKREAVEELPGVTLDSSAKNKPSETVSEEYPNLHPHLSEQHFKDLFDIFGDHKLSWLDSIIGRFENMDHEDLAKLNDLEELLKYNIDTRRQSHGFPDMDNTSECQALQKLSFVLSTVRENYTQGNTKVKVDEGPGGSREECSHGACLSLNENTQIFTQEADTNQMTKDRSDISDTRHPIDVSVAEEKGLLKNIKNAKEFQTFDQDMRNLKESTDFEIKKSSFQLHQGLFSEEHEKTQSGFQKFNQILSDFITSDGLASIVDQVVSSLPDDLRPGPDLYGLPWEAVVFTGFFGLCTLLLFSCRFINSIKSRHYASKEKQMAQKVAELLDEKCKVLETFSEVKQQYEKLESTLQNGGISAQTAEKETLEVTSQELEQSNSQMKREVERLQEELSQQNESRKQQEDQLAELDQILRNLEEEAKQRKSQLEQDNTTLKIHNMNSERLQKNLQVAKEEHDMLLESKDQLVLEAEVWNERLGELEEEMKLCKRSHAGMMEDCVNKDERIKSLTDCLLKMRDWDSEDETVDGSNNITRAENGDSTDFHQKQKVQKLIEAAKMSADLKSMEEDKNRAFAKLTDEMKAKEDLQEGIKELKEDKGLLESESAKYSSEIQKLQQKLQIMTEMYQENELKLHRMLTVEEKERSQKEEKLNKAGKKISLAAEELNNYRQRAKDLEEELERTSQAYKNQIASHEKKAHDNWLAARAADRDLTDFRRENANLRQRLTDSQFKLEILEKDPYVRDGRPLLRGERSPYGPSPLGRPSSETRAFLSPPTLMDGPPRLSPQFGMGPVARVSRGVLEPPSGGQDFQRSGPRSDSGSLSPSWDRERRGPPGPPGHPLPDPGLPYRRPPPGPYPMGALPPRPPHPDSGYLGDKPADSSFLRNSSAVSENENRDGPHSMPGDMRIPPGPDLRMGPLPGPPLMRMPPPMDPRNPHIPLRGPYGPPEFYPTRGPGGPPMGMRGPFPPGMFPRAPLPHPQHMGYLPPRPQSDNFPPGPPPRPSPPGSEQRLEQSPSPHDVI